MQICTAISGYRSLLLFLCVRRYIKADQWISNRNGKSWCMFVLGRITRTIVDLHHSANEKNSIDCSCLSCNTEQDLASNRLNLGLFVILPINTVQHSWNPFHESGSLLVYLVASLNKLERNFPGHLDEKVVGNCNHYITPVEVSTNIRRRPFLSFRSTPLHQVFVANSRNSGLGFDGIFFSFFWSSPGYEWIRLIAVAFRLRLLSAAKASPQATFYGLNAG